MNEITALKAGKGRQKRVNLFLDGKYAFSVEEELVAREGLRVGQELSAERIEGLQGSDRIQRCFNAAMQLLGYRQRSEAELMGRLQKRGFDSGAIDAVLSKLKSYGLVDDDAFARSWQETRSAFSPRSRWLTGRELRQKGVADETIARVTEGIDDLENARQAAQGRVRRLPLTDYQSFRRRLGSFLRRRGFSYGVVHRVVEQTWREFGSSS